MNIQEIVKVIAVVKALVPVQRFDDQAPTAWHLILGDLRFQDVMDVMKPVALANDYITPRALHAAVKNLRAERVKRFGGYTTSVEDLTIEHDLRERRAIRDAIADGTLTKSSYVDYLASGITLTPARPQLAATST